MKIDENRGFTLIELMVVVTIIGILLTLGIPSFQKLILYSRLEEAKTFASALSAAERRYLLEKGSYYVDTGSGSPNQEDDLFTGLGVRLQDSPNFCYEITCNPKYLNGNLCPAPTNTTDWHFYVTAFLRQGAGQSSVAGCNVTGGVTVPPNTKPAEDSWVSTSGKAGKALFLCWPHTSNCDLATYTNWEDGITVDDFFN